MSADQARQIFIPLAGLLAGGDIQAYMLWERADALLDRLLGERAAAFNEAMRDFDFAAALTHLRGTRAAYPQLDAARPYED